MTEVNGSPTMCLGADNASLPKVAAKIELKPPGFSRAPEDLPVAVPRRHLNISGWPRLLERLVQIGLARLVPLSSIPRAHERVLLGGLFGVQKADSHLRRMIVDRRPQNACELGPELALLRYLHQYPLEEEEARQYPWSFLMRLGTLPRAALFTDALWTSSTRMVACVEDAKDFFYLLSMPMCRHCETLQRECLWGTGACWCSASLNF
eukprot:5235579-Amphidinium_carterae.3